MKILFCTILLLSKNLSGEFPEMLRSRPHRPAVLDPCIKTKCPKISTALLSKREFLRLKNISQSEKMKIQEHSWTKILRKRRKQRSFNQRRTKRSSARTIVSLNTKHKTYHSNKKCHKYAVFKVIWFLCPYFSKNSQFLMFLPSYWGVLNGISYSNWLHNEQHP